MKRSIREILQMTFAALLPHLLFAQSGSLLGARNRPRWDGLVRFSQPTIAPFAAGISLFCAIAAYAQSGTSFRRRKLILLVTFAALLPRLLFAQSGTLGSTSSPVVNSLGQPMGGVDVAICQSLATAAAQVISNTAVLTMATNPITAGFAAGTQIQVSGFSGGDTYFNGGTFTNGTGISNGYTILSVTSTTITYSVTHANATATTNGTVLQMGNSTTSCAGLAAVYSDAALTQPVTQPIVTDGLGNWNAFTSAGASQLYYLQFYGAGITTSLRVMVAATNGAVTAPQISDGLCTFGPNGNDSNDGRTAPKLTLLGCWNAIPSVSGTIYELGSRDSVAQCTPTAGQGFGIAGPSDPNYGSMPGVIGNTYWVRAKANSVRIQGLSAADYGAASAVGSVTKLNCGNSTTPALWLSNVGNGFSMDRIELAQGAQAVRLGVDSNNSRTSTLGASSSLEFTNMVTNSVSGGGPTWDVGAVLWVTLSNIQAANNSGSAVTANSASNFYFSTSNSGPFLGNIYMDHIEMTGGGGIRFDANSGVSASIWARRLFMQGVGQSQPVFEVVNSGNFAAHIILDGGESDSGANPAIIKVNPANNPCSTTIDGANQFNFYGIIEGPVTIGSGLCSPAANPGGVPTYSNGTPEPNVIPAAKNERQTSTYEIAPAADAFRRSFAPSFVRFANLAAQSLANWTTGEGTSLSLTQIQGPGDPSGTTNAATLNCTANGTNGGCDYIAYNNNIAFSAGDYIYVGVWAQPASTAGLATCGDQFGCPLGMEMSANPVTVKVMAGYPDAVGSIGNNGMTTCAFTCMFARPYYQTDGNWQYMWVLAKVLTPAASATTVKMHLSFKTGFPLNAYAPVLVRIPASSVALVAAPTFSSASESGNTVTWTTSAAHNLSGAMPIVISGCSVSAYNTVVGSDDVVVGTATSTTFTTFNPTTGLGAPTGCVITPGNDSEIADWANNNASYGDNCTLGTYCGIRGVTVPKVIALGTSTLGNSSIGSGVCATVVTTAATGVLTTDRIEWSYASAPATVDGLLILSPYVTAGNVNWKLCNPTASSQTPSGLVVNWEVLR